MYYYVYIYNKIFENQTRVHDSFKITFYEFFLICLKNLLKISHIKQLYVKLRESKKQSDKNGFFAVYW